MSDVDSLLEELEEIILDEEETKKAVARLRIELFDKQLAVWDDKSRQVAVLAPRRAGKTNVWTRLTVARALETPRSLQRLWASSRLKCKELLWREFKWLLARQGLEAHFNETELSVTFANESIIQLVGADRDVDAQKKRGSKTLTEIVLEAQNFPGFLQSMVDDVIVPSLLDLGGTIYLEGTPGIVCAGFWFYVSGGNDVDLRWNKEGWSVHRWALVDNPHMRERWPDVLAMKAQRGWGDTHPTWRREYEARWVSDFSALYYNFTPGRNFYDTEEVVPWGPGWNHVLGWDLGFRDDMALTVLAWRDYDDCIYEAFSWKKPGALAAEVMEQVKELEERGFNFVKMVADTGGGGRMYVEEVMSRYNYHFEAAKKSDKWAHVSLLNEDLRRGKLKLRPGSALADEMAVLPKDPDWPPPESPEKPPREHPGFANHACDSALYAHRWAQSYLAEARPVEKPVGSQAWADEEEEKIAASVRRGLDMHPLDDQDADFEDPFDAYG